MIYNINMVVRIDSDLSQKELEEQLVIALHNTESSYSKLDGVDSNLEVLDYISTEVNKV